MNNRKLILSLDDSDLDRAVKIQGTQFDRKRKLNDAQKKRIEKLFSSGSCSLEELAEMYNVDYRTIRAYIDPTYREHVNNLSRSWYEKTHYNGHTPEELKRSMLDRIAYKRKLVKKRKIKV